MWYMKSKTRGEGSGPSPTTHMPYQQRFFKDKCFIVSGKEPQATGEPPAGTTKAEEAARHLQYTLLKAESWDARTTHAFKAWGDTARYRGWSLGGTLMDTQANRGCFEPHYSNIG